MHELVRQFRAAAESRRGGIPGRGGRYSDAMRGLAVRYLEDARGIGRSLKAAATDLGIHPDTLDEWRRKQCTVLAPVVTRVHITDDPRRRRSALTVHLPGGVAVSGLDIDDAVDLMARLA